MYTFDCYAINIFLCVHVYSFILFKILYWEPADRVAKRRTRFRIRSTLTNIYGLPAAGKSKKFTVSKRRSAMRSRPWTGFKVHGSRPVLRLIYILWFRYEVSNIRLDCTIIARLILYARINSCVWACMRVRMHKSLRNGHNACIIVV